MLTINEIINAKTSADILTAHTGKNLEVMDVNIKLNHSHRRFNALKALKAYKTAYKVNPSSPETTIAWRVVVSAISFWRKNFFNAMGSIKEIVTFDEAYALWIEYFMHFCGFFVDHGYISTDKLFGGPCKIDCEFEYDNPRATHHTNKVTNFYFVKDSEGNRTSRKFIRNINASHTEFKASERRNMEKSTERKLIYDYLVSKGYFFELTIAGNTAMYRSLGTKDLTKALKEDESNIPGMNDYYAKFISLHMVESICKEFGVKKALKRWLSNRDNLTEALVNNDVEENCHNEVKVENKIEVKEEVLGTEAPTAEVESNKIEEVVADGTAPGAKEEEEFIEFVDDTNKPASVKDFASFDAWFQKYGNTSNEFLLLSHYREYLERYKNGYRLSQDDLAIQLFESDLWTEKEVRSSTEHWILEKLAA